MPDGRPVKSHGLTFAPDMVRALLSVKKTQTRRPVAQHNSTVLGYQAKRLWEMLYGWDLAYVDGPKDPIGGGEGYNYWHVPALEYKDAERVRPPACWFRVRPRIMPGDRIWVKETFWTYPGDITARMLREGADTWPIINDIPCIYAADDRYGKFGEDWCIEEGWVRRPSIFMPRKFSRITLLVKAVRSQRVNEISDDDAFQEGVQRSPAFSHREHFLALWDRIYASRGVGVGSHHPVWVYDFEVETGD